MLRRLTVFVATAFIATASFAALNVGEPAPSFTGTDVLSGKTVSSNGLKGKTIVLEWNNFECPFVKKFYGANAMQTLQKAATQDGIVWVTVNSSAKGKEGSFADAVDAKAAALAHKSNASHYLLDHDGTIGKAYGAKTTPHMYVIDAEGKLIYQGAIDSINSTDANDIPKATNYVTEALTALKAGTPVKTASTQAYGCFVKY